MITGDKEKLDQIAQTHLCPEHGKKLVVAWDAGTKSYAIRCGEGHFPEEVTRELTRTQEFKAGKLEKVDPMFNLLPKTDMATGELLTPEAIQFLVDYANRYGLDAYRGHVVYMYGKPYIGLDGYLWHAKNSGRPYSLESKPLQREERIQYQIPEGAYAWLSTIRFEGLGNYLTGLGIVTSEEMTLTSKKDKTKLRSPVVAAHPWQLAQKRAEWQALRRAFPIGETEEAKEE